MTSATPAVRSRGPLERLPNAFGVLPLLVLAACSTLPEGARVDPAQAYAAAIADAAVASPRKVLPLQALPEEETLAVVSWMSEKKIPACSRDALPCELTLGDRPLWVTLAGEVREKCRAWTLHGEPLRRRIEQLLGLPMDPPPAYRGAAFVEFRVARAAVERPCLGVDASDPARPVCTLAASPTSAPALRNFVGQQMADSYVVDSPQGPGYPFTRLGYTYDWSSTADAGHYGASEFIVRPASTLTVLAVHTADDYCRAR